MNQTTAKAQDSSNNMPVNALYIRLFSLCIVVVVLVVAWSGAATGMDFIGRSARLVLPNWMLVLTIILLGVPHGALDFVKARRQLQLPAMSRYVLAYVGVTAFSFYLLAQFPQWVLPLLLVIASWHFGETYRVMFYHPNGEAPRQYWLRTVSVLGAFAIGALPITLAVFAFSSTKMGMSEAFALFTAIGGEAAAQSTVAVWLIGMEFFYLMPLLAMAFGIWRIARASSARRFSCALDVMEVFLTFAIFVFTPVLLAFTLYFCFIHAPRHTAFALQELAGQFKLRLLLLEALAVSLTAVALIWGLSRVLPLGSDLMQGDNVSLLFSGLLAITVAHAAHDRICRFLR